MKFGELPLSQAEGSILAHSLTIGGKKLSKGRWLTADDLAAIAGDGRTSVIAATLESGDLHEDEAAARLAAALVPDEAGAGIRLTRAATGRVNVYAAVAGVVEIDVEAVARANDINPMITLATVPQYHRTDPDHMVATVKIIAYGVPEADVVAACEALRSAMRVRPAIYKTATLIETVTDAEEPSPKGRQAMNGRLFRLGLSLTPRVIVTHEEQAVSDAIRAAEGEVVMILTGSATSDPFDVAPSGVRHAGGVVTRFGMPVDPGNLLFIGALGNRPVIGLPGCARSPALNGADWVLERVLCGIPVGHAEIAGMGVGGLLKEIPTRPSPREG